MKKIIALFLLACMPINTADAREASMSLNCFGKSCEQGEQPHSGDSTEHGRQWPGENSPQNMENVVNDKVDFSGVYAPINTTNTSETNKSSTGEIPMQNTTVVANNTSDWKRLLLAPGGVVVGVLLGNLFREGPQVQRMQEQIGQLQELIQPIEQRLNRVQNHVQQIPGQMQGLIQPIEQRLQQVEHNVQQIQPIQRQIQDVQRQIPEQVQEVQQQIGQLQRQIGQVENQVQGLQERLNPDNDDEDMESEKDDSDSVGPDDAPKSKNTGNGKSKNTGNGKSKKTGNGKPKKNGRAKPLDVNMDLESDDDSFVVVPQGKGLGVFKTQRKAAKKAEQQMQQQLVSTNRGRKRPNPPQVDRLKRLGMEIEQPENPDIFDEAPKKRVRR